LQGPQRLTFSIRKPNSMLAAVEVGPLPLLPRRPDAGPIHCYANRLAASPGSDLRVLAGVGGRRGA
jgi:hypothetical protein